MEKGPAVFQSFLEKKVTQEKTLQTEKGQDEFSRNGSVSYQDH